jgi:HSP20 family molecular chaperone IbpA
VKKEDKMSENRTETKTITAVLTDPAHESKSPFVPSVRVEIAIDQNEGNVAIRFPGVDSEQVSIFVYDGQVRLSIFDKDCIDSTWEFYLDDNNEFKNAKSK